MSKHICLDPDDTSMAGENPNPQQMGRRERIAAGIIEDFDPSKPRLGRRESEPHSSEITYICDVLRSNFPKHRVTWDLHHYFIVDGEEFDMEFDVSLFKDLSLPVQLSSYRAAEHGGRVPDMAINVMSKSTWLADVGAHVDTCRMIKIPVYVIYAPFNVASRPYQPPFLRVHVLNERGEYHVQETRAVAIAGGNVVNMAATIDCGVGWPFRLGLQELQGEKHEKGWQLYRLVFIDSMEQHVLSTSLEKERSRSEQEKARADHAEMELARVQKRV
jgi:hypothetical protein